MRGTEEGARNTVLNAAAFCFGQLDGACRIDADSVRGLLWEACAGYRAADGDGKARLTIASGWDDGRRKPLHSRERALGVYCLDGPRGLGLEPLGDARRLLDCYGEKLMIAWSGGGTTDREAALYTLASSGVWTRDPAQLGAWHCEQARLWETRVVEAAGEGDGPQDLDLVEDVVKAAKGYLKRAREPKGREKCLDSLPVLVLHLAERDELPDGFTQCETGELDATRWLGTPNGVIDPNSGRLLPPDEGRNALVTRSLPDPYDPDATHPDVERLTAHLSGELAGYVWDMLAYALHGQPARTFVVLTGATGGGKSTLARAVQAALGPGYAGALADGAITPQRGGRGANQATPDMESVMPPRRVAFSPEVENLKPDSARVKALTGGDQQAWRPLYGNPRYGVPTASVWLLGNKPPTGLGLTDPAMLERVRAVPYPEVPRNKRDAGLVEAFHGDSPGVRERRQALAARLIRRAAALKPGQPPKPTPVVSEAIDRLRDADLGPVGVWLRDTIQTPEDMLTMAPPPAALIRGCGAPGAVELAGDVDGERLRPFGVADLLHALGRASDAGVVNEGVQPTEARLGGLEEAVDGAAIGHIAEADGNSHRRAPPYSDLLEQVHGKHRQSVEVRLARGRGSWGPLLRVEKRAGCRLRNPLRWRRIRPSSRRREGDAAGNGRNHAEADSRTDLRDRGTARCGRWPGVRIRGEPSDGGRIAELRANFGELRP